MYHDNIKDVSEDNAEFRKILYTGKYGQLVTMSLKPGEELGAEVHEDTDQIIFIVEGDAEATVNDERVGIEEDDVLFVPAGAKHNVKNIGQEALKLYTVYSPPVHVEK